MIEFTTLCGFLQLLDVFSFIIEESGHYLWQGAVQIWGDIHFSRTIRGRPFKMIWGWSRRKSIKKI